MKYKAIIEKTWKAAAIGAAGLAPVAPARIY